MKARLVLHPHGKSDAPFSEDQYQDIEGLMLEGAWSPDIARYMTRHDIKGLYLNYARGWAGNDYEFLRELPQLQLLQISSLDRPHLKAIESLPNLKYLSLSPAPVGEIDFSHLPNLRSCFMPWWKGASSLFDHSHLEYLYLDTFRSKDFAPLGKLTSLRRLAIGNSNIDSLESISNLKKIEKLELLECQELEKLDGIESLENLKWLRIDGSNRLSRIEPISRLNGLQILDLSDCNRIPSLKPIIELKNLRAVAFDGSTDIEDGDLSVLESLPHLSMLMFRPRRHYSHQLAKVWNWKNYSVPDKLLSAKKK